MSKRKRTIGDDGEFTVDMAASPSRVQTQREDTPEEELSPPYQQIVVLYKQAWGCFIILVALCGLLVLCRTAANLQTKTGYTAKEQFESCIVPDNYDSTGSQICQRENHIDRLDR